MRVTISCRYCIAFKVMLFFSSFFFVFLSRSEAGALFVRG